MRGASAVARAGGAVDPVAAPAAKADLGDVRAWARDNGFSVSDRGRVSSEVMSAYEAAH
jgi:hypothetical protein